MPQDNKKPGLWALFLKLGTKFLSFIGKFIKLSKIGFAAVTFAGYWAFISWKFALLIMVAIGFHESGHVWAMKRMGIKTKGFYFLPFIGGAAIAEEEYRTYGENAYIAIMGPIWGMVLSFASVGMYWLTGNTMWASAGAWMAVLNLFNLLPISPLDGGQIMRAIAFSINKTAGVVFMAVSIVAAALIMWKFHIMLFVLLLIISGLELFSEVTRRLKLKQYNNGTLVKWALPKSMLDGEGNVKKYPTDMNWSQLLLTVSAYVTTIILLFQITYLAQNVPGGSLAKSFFN